MSKFYLTLLFSIFMVYANAQIEERRLFFDVSGSAFLPRFVATSKNDERFNSYMQNRGAAGILKFGLGLQYPTNFTVSLKGSFAFLDFIENNYYADLETTYPDTYFYSNQISNNNDSTMFLEYTFGVEFGYLKKFEKIAIKPNFEVGVFSGTLKDITYGYRTENENLITVVSFSPTVVPSVYFHPSFDLGLTKWKRSFIHFSYSYTPCRVQVTTKEQFPNDTFLSSTEINRYAYHRFMIGYKFAFLR